MENANIMGSKTVSRAALSMSMTATREEEVKLKDKLASEGVSAAGIDFGGEFLGSIPKIVERSVVAAKREGVISQTSYHEEGSVAGAAREALSQITLKASGLSVGGKIGVARSGNNIAVAVFFGIGLLHFNEIAVGLGHRAI